MNIRKLIFLIAFLLAARPAWADAYHRCDDAPSNRVCVLTYGRVTVRIESDEANKVRRFILYTDDRTADADRLTIAVGRLMMAIKPDSTADERADFMLSALKNDFAKRWGGFYWKVSFMQPSVLRIIAERE